jgi:hypothetical protein
MNPYVLISAGVAVIILSISAFAFGVRYEKGQHARAEQLVALVREQAQLGAADAIAKNRPIQQIIKQRLETEVRENTVYRDCRNSADALRLLNDALAGRASDPIGGSQLPGADASH